jgi:hypothetical protein
MEIFRQHELMRFIYHRLMNTEKNSAWYAKRIQQMDCFNTPMECVPELLLYLKGFYSFSDSHDIEYLDDRILYYESMIQYETVREPRVPKNVLRRRKIETVSTK